MYGNSEKGKCVRWVFSNNTKSFDGTSYKLHHCMWGCLTTDNRD